MDDKSLDEDLDTLKKGLHSVKSLLAIEDLSSLISYTDELTQFHNLVSEKLSVLLLARASLVKEFQNLLVYFCEDPLVSPLNSIKSFFTLFQEFFDAMQKILQEMEEEKLKSIQRERRKSSYTVCTYILLYFSSLV